MTDRHEGSVAVDSHAPLSFGGTVKTVLETPEDDAAPGDARGGPQPARPPRADRGDHAPDREPGHQVRLLPAGLDHRPRDGQGRRLRPSSRRWPSSGYQLVYGATANLFTDRAGNYIGFGPEESELAAIADLDTFAQLPWDPRVARVYCDCYDTETGELLDADPRQNLKRVVAEFERELGYSFLIGIEPEMMWLRAPRTARRPRA